MATLLDRIRAKFGRRAGRPRAPRTPQPKFLDHDPALRRRLEREQIAREARWRMLC